MWIFPWLIKLAIIYMMNRLVVLSTRCKTNVKNSQRPDNYPTCISCKIWEEEGAKSSYLRSWKQKILILARKNDLTFDESLQLCVTVTPERCKINKYLYLNPSTTLPNHAPTLRLFYSWLSNCWHSVTCHISSSAAPSQTVDFSTHVLFFQRDLLLLVSTTYLTMQYQCACVYSCFSPADNTSWFRKSLCHMSPGTPPPPQRGKPNKLTRDTIKFTVNVSREEADSLNHVAHCGETRVENLAGSSSRRGHWGGWARVRRRCIQRAPIEKMPHHTQLVV